MICYFVVITSPAQSDYRLGFFMKKIIAKLFPAKKVSSDQPIPMPGLTSTSGTAPSSRGKPFEHTQGKRKNPWGLIVALVFVGLGVVGGQSLLNNRKSVQGVSTTTQSSAKKETAINRTFEFKAYDKNKKLSDKKVSYTLTTAEKTNDIIIKGKRATAISGRSFLIINLKIANSEDDSRFLNTRNYIRIQPKGSQDNLAPDIHNDTVEIQPLSTKLTRVGVPINESDTEFTLFVGEVEGSKEEITISL